MTQREMVPCACGGAIRLQPTRSPWEFTGRCAACHRGVLTSWAHAEAPPVFVAENQGALPLECSA